MPLVPPNQLREKVLLIGPGKSGKTSAYLSVAWWSFKSGGHEQFHVISTDDEAIEAVMLDDKYAGMLAEDGGNIHLYRVNTWEEYQEASEKIVAAVQKGDWICIDFVTDAWVEVANFYLREVRKTDRAEMVMKAAKEGKVGWELNREVDYQVVNPWYDQWIKPMLFSRAHIFMVAKQDEIFEGNKMSEKDKEHMREWGKYKAKGQKDLPFQCRSYLRIQRLARGRVLFTLGDRAREELNGADMSDFFTGYLRDVAGWSYSMPEAPKA